VILAGGSGTRLWPLSRARLPKQLLAIAEPRSMLQATVARTAALAGAGITALPPLVVAGEALRRMVARQLAELGTPMAALILEPEGRNTAPAIALAALWAMAAGEGEVPMLVMPSDHVIGLPQTFAQAVATAWPAAVAGRLVTFGITPESPETGYGYIETGAALADCPGVHAVARFVEKPDLARAERYVAGGQHLWNGGIFLLTPDALMQALQQHAPDIADAVTAAMTCATRNTTELRPDAAAFAQAPSLSIDHAVMEHTSHAAVVPVAMEWSDVGSWDALWQISDRDEAGNALVGEAVLLDVQDSLIRVEPGAPAVAALGLSGMVIVSMPDAVMVAPRARVQEVKALADAAQAIGRNGVPYGARSGGRGTQLHEWGMAETLDSGPGHAELRLRINPGATTRFEGPAQLIAVCGVGLAGDERLAAGAARHIPGGQILTLHNSGGAPWQLIAVQFGSGAP
jgi:mannose-1-phosphate guanylyltransferase/mannose-6-phosphate isomerase